MSKNKWIIIGVLLFIAYTWYMIYNAQLGKHASYEAGYAEGYDAGYSAAMEDYNIED